MDSACNARQNRPGLKLSRAGFLTAVLPESSLQGTSVDLQSAVTLLLSRKDKIESNIANVTKTNNLHERITVQELDKVSLHHDSSEYQRDDLGEEVRSSFEKLTSPLSSSPPQPSCIPPLIQR